MEQLERRALAARSQHYLRETARRGAAFERVGAFACTFDAVSDNPYVNYAIPDDGAMPARENIEALVARFEKRRRRPRLEYLPDAAPQVETALLAAGFRAEGKFPVMTCGQNDVGSVAPPNGIGVLEAATEDDFVSGSAAQAEAFGSDVPRPEWLRRTANGGGVVMLACDAASGLCAGAGSCMKPVDGVSELGGIGVRHAYRRQGIAGALTSALTHAILAKGASLVWLTPGHDEAGRVYARAGFAKACEALHVARD